MNPLRTPLALLALVLAAPALVAQQSELTLKQRLAHLEQVFEAARIENHVPGIALGVVQNDKLIFARGFGLADFESGRKVQPDTLFAIGSSSKAFTATLAAMLVEEGKMAWDDPITTWLPGYDLEVLSDDESAVVTLRDVMSHRTGYPRQSVLFASGKVQPQRILATAPKGKPYSPFRQNFHYNNVQFLAAGEATAVAAGTTWEQLLQARLFDPLDMKASTIDHLTLVKNPKMAVGYHWQSEKKELKRLELRDIRNIAPAGAIHSNILDMSRWLRFQLAMGVIDGKRLVAAEHLAELRNSNIGLGDEGGYGMGWMLSSWNDHEVVQHGGNIDGFSTSVGMMPDQDLGFVLLSNISASGLQGASLGMVWESMVGDWRPKAVEASATGGEDFGPLLGEYVAGYGSIKGTVMTVLENDGKLALDVPGQMVFELKEPDENGLRTFAILDAVKVGFEFDPTGKAHALILHQGGVEMIAARKGTEGRGKLKEVEMHPFTGKYHFEALDADCEARSEDGILILDIPQQGAFGLFPPDDDGKRAFRALKHRDVTFQHNDAGEVVSLTLITPTENHVMARIEGAVIEAWPTTAEVLEMFGNRERAKIVPKLGNVRLQGRVLVEQSGIEGTFTAWIMPGMRHSFFLDFGDFGTLKSVVDGNSGFNDSDFSPFMEMTAEEQQVSWENLPGVTASSYFDMFESVELTGKNERDGRTTWIMSCKNGERPASLVEVDADSGDIVYMLSFAPVADMGYIPSENFFSDFREVAGLRIPHRIEGTTDQGGRSIMTLESIDTTFEVPESAFERR